MAREVGPKGKQMKAIPIREVPDTPGMLGSGFNSPGLFRVIIENPPQGANVKNIRDRVRVLDAIDALKAGATELVLEDADYATLRAAIEAHTFGKATRELLQVIDDVMTAQAPIPPPTE